MTLADTFLFLRGQPLLTLAIAAVFVVTLGGMLSRSLPRLGGFVRGIGNLGLTAALLLTIAQVARFTSGTDLALPQLGLPEQKVAGGETRIPMSPDGHFWIKADVNGEPTRFLVDTGATVTAISTGTAARTGITPLPLREKVTLRTANGAIQADVGTIAEMRFGNVVARDLDTIIAPALGDNNVVGMNLLSRLASWRVEGRTLILVPHHPERNGQQL